ncbi:hypothetical protein LMH73_026310 [Vibrio splendidus]|nr:hypothetical protein [Vibrio splendidus]MCC4880425.1 hypothetical protein [Vibrio splendidus]
MNKKIVIPRKKFELIYQSFKTIWEANKPSSEDGVRLKELRSKNEHEISEDESMEIKDLLAGIRIGEVPSDSAMERIFYSFFGFKNQLEVVKFANDGVEKLWVTKNLGSYDIIPDKELYDSAMRDAFAPFLFTSRVEKTANKRALQKRDPIVQSFYQEAMHFTEMFEYDQDDWEVYPANEASIKELIDNIENRVTIVVNMTDSDVLFDKYQLDSMGYEVVYVNRANSVERLNELKTDGLVLDGKVYRTRVVKGTNMDLLGSLILKSSLMGAKWVVEISDKLEKHKNFRDRIVNLINISDITIKIK